MPLLLNIVKWILTLFGVLSSSPKENAAIIKEAEDKEAAQEAATQAKINTALLEQHDAHVQTIHDLTDDELARRLSDPPAEG